VPPRPMKPCRQAGCSILTQDRSGYCPEHAALAEKRRQQQRAQYDKRRESAAKRGYGRKWQEAREGFLSRNSLCVACKQRGRIEPATVVDHIKPHRGDMALFWDRSNWQALCERCHNLKTARGE